MSVPPKSPPSSDIAGVHRDKVDVDVPANATPDPGKALDKADDESTGQPDQKRD